MDVRRTCPEREGLKVRHRSFQGRLIDLYKGRSFAIEEGIGIVLPEGRQGDMPGPVEGQHQSSAHHVPERPVGLHPLPGFAQPPGQGPPAVLRTIGGEPPDKSNVFPRDHAAAVANRRFHGECVT